jgi:hypothetical protein
MPVAAAELAGSLARVLPVRCPPASGWLEAGEGAIPF